MEAVLGKERSVLTHILVVSRGEKPYEPLERALREFAKGIADCIGLQRVEWGKNINPTGLELSYDYLCVTELADLETLRTSYWEHPAHRRLLAELPELCTSRFALDIESD